MQQDTARYALPPSLLDETPAPTQPSSPSDYSSSLPSLSNSNPSPSFLSAQAQHLPPPASHLLKQFPSSIDNEFDPTTISKDDPPNIMSFERSPLQAPSAPTLTRSKTSTQPSTRSIPAPSSPSSSDHRWSATSNQSPWSAARHVGTIGSGSASAKVPSTATFSNSPPQTRPKPTNARHASFRMPPDEGDISEGDDSSPDRSSHGHQHQHQHQHQPPSRPHSPPLAPPHASRSRSHSLAGNRPVGLAFSVPSSGAPGLGEGLWRGLAKGGPGRSVARGGNGNESDEGEVVDERFPMESRRAKSRGGAPSSGAGDLSNMSPFSRDLQEILREPTHPILFGSSHHAPSTTHLAANARFTDEFGFGHGNLGGTNLSSFTSHVNSFPRRFDSQYADGGHGLGGHAFSPEKSGQGMGGGMTSGQASGATSRRHSVSVVGRRAGGAGGDRYMPDSPERSMGLTFAGGLGWKSGTGFGNDAGSGRGGAGFSDEDLAFSLGELSMGQQQGSRPESSSFVNIAPSSASYQHPSSLPIFAPDNSSYQRSYEQDGLSQGLGMLGKSMGAGDGFASLRQQHQLQQNRAGDNERDGGVSSGGFLGVGRPASKSRSASYSGVLKGRRWDGGRQLEEDDEDEEGSEDGGMELEGTFEDEDRVGRFALRVDSRPVEQPRSLDRGLQTDQQHQQPIYGLGLSGSPAPPEIVNARARQHSQHLPIGNVSSNPSRALPPPNPAPPSAMTGYYPFVSSTASAQPSQQQQHIQQQQQQHARHLSQPQMGFRQPPPSGFYPQQQQQQQQPGPGGWYGLQQGLPSPIGPQRTGGRQQSFDPQQQAQQQRGFVPQQQQTRPNPGQPFYPSQQQLLQQHQQQYPPFYPQPPQYNLQHHQRQLSSPTTSTTSPSGASSNLVNSPLTPTSSISPPSLTELGKGLPLSSVPLSTPLYIVEFKAGRTDLFYCPDISLSLAKGDLVIVEADRGKDLGKVVNDSITLEEVREFQEGQAELLRIQQMAGLAPGGGGGGKSKEITPKRIFSKAQALDAQLLLLKMQDEAKALALCQQKVKQKALPMEVVDAEFQWDRRKLTFYFVAERRIDFRELVRELFRHFKTRIWMACLAGPATTEPSTAGAIQPPQQQ